MPESFLILLPPADRDLAVKALLAFGGEDAAFLAGMFADAVPGGEVLNDFGA